MSMKKQQGFSMLEVLISMVIIMFGLLGIAGTQMLVINNTENARYQGVAASLASGLSAAMRGNSAYWSAASLANITITGVSGDSTQTTISSDFGTIPSYVDCANAICSKRQMAYYDLLNYGEAVARLLPPVSATSSASTTIVCGSDAPTTCKVTLSWSENNVAVANRSGTEVGALANGATGTHTFQTFVAIVI